MTLCATCPLRNRISVGIESTSNAAAVCWFSSVLSLTIFRSSRSPAISSSTGATTRHGPHQGAQKSTSVGLVGLEDLGLEVRVGDFGDVGCHRFSCRSGLLLLLYKVKQDRRSVSARRNRICGTRQTASNAMRGDILLVPTSRSRKTIGISTHAEAVAHGSVRELDLERVALRAHGVERDGLEHLAPVALEAAGQVAHGHAEHVLGVPAAPARERPAAAGPKPRPRRRARSASRARRRRRLRHPQQPREIGGVVGEVGVHLADVSRPRPRVRAGSRPGRRARGRPWWGGAGPRPRRAAGAGGRRWRRCRRASHRRR